MLKLLFIWRIHWIRTGFLPSTYNLLREMWKNSDSIINLSSLASLNIENIDATLAISAKV